jgi:hydrogenase nickel incorporation protein HypA/HybF
MHETALMQNLIETTLEVLKNRNIIRVDRVTVSVGKFANVLPDALSFAFEAMTGDGILKGAKLEIVNTPAVARCGDCGYEYQTDSFPFVCPVCKSRMFILKSGEEVYIQNIYCEEKETDDKTGCQAGSESP